MTANWKKIEGDSREKYQLYLCSREWSERREVVRERAKGVCELCKALPMDAVHHLTYERKYQERLDDLQAICKPCHEFTHGKADYDPSDDTRWLSYLLACEREKNTPVPPGILDGDEATPETHVIDMCWSAADVLFSNEAYAAAHRYQRVADAIAQLAEFAYVEWLRRGRPRPLQYNKFCRFWSQQPFAVYQEHVAEFLECEKDYIAANCGAPHQ